MRYAYDADACSGRRDDPVRHITEGGIAALAWCEEPDGLLYAAAATGAVEPDVRSLTRRCGPGRATASAAPRWKHRRHPEPGRQRRRLWLIARRTIGGVTRRYIEFIEAAGSGHHVDAGLLCDSAATGTVTGLGHGGQTVKILADGSVRVPQVVWRRRGDQRAGCETVRVGLPYTHRMRPCRPRLVRRRAARRARPSGCTRCACACWKAGLALRLRGRGTGNPVSPRRRPDGSGAAAVQRLQGQPRGRLRRRGRDLDRGRRPLPFTRTLLIRELVTHG